jgi:DNA gyrase subunit A
MIAMKLGEGEGILGVETCTEKDDVILTTHLGRCIRFAVPEVRVFAGRNSVGVRGIQLEEGDSVISMSILHHFDATADERAAFQKMSRAVRGESEVEETNSDGEEEAAAGELPQERYAEMSAAEQFILTLSEKGYGKRTSSFDYRITGRGGKGIVAMDIWEKDPETKEPRIRRKTGTLVASFPVDHGDQIMLISDAGQIIRVPVDDIRIAGRGTQGVIVFNTAEDEKVVSVERLSEEDEEQAES